MALSTGTRFGRYEIIALLGAGGMGEVFRARDTKLNRFVAIKVLPDLVAADPTRLARFRREAQVLASINHPNIAHVHEFEDSTGVHALVMELVDGPTLADRIEQGALPLDEAIAIARQIAEALAAAHDQGIIHRDLKPANIKVRDDGTVKVLDFGLAKLAGPDASDSAQTELGQLPTITTPAMTLAGVIMGTAAYMSPEQTKGRPADKRSDVWAFGAVLYEMLTARRAFEGEDVSETLANVLKTDPDWNTLPANVPAHIRALVQRCLTKDRRVRVSDIGVALFVLNDDGKLTTNVATANERFEAPRRRSLWWPLTFAALGLLIAGTIVGVSVWLTTRPTAEPPLRFLFAQAGPTAIAIDAQSRDLAITPDGTRVIYKSQIGANSQLNIRGMDALEPTALALPGAPRAPFVSPDGQWIGYVEPGPITLKKVPITGGPAVALTALDGASRGATWTEDDQIIFATAVTSTGLQRIPVAGGKPTVLTTPSPDRGEQDHLFPQILPGGRAVLFTITPSNANLDDAQIAALDLRDTSKPPKILLRGGTQAKYVSTGHLVYAAAGTLRAIAFDLDRLETVGTPVPVQSQVITLPSGTAEFDISANGTLVYATGGGSGVPTRRLVWVDRNGNEESIKDAPVRSYVHPRLSPDGTRVAIDIRDQSNDVWVWDIKSQTLTRVSTDPDLDQTPEWLPDSRHLVFSSQETGVFSIVRRAADGSGTSEALARTPNPLRLSSVSRDGKRVFSFESRAATSLDILELDLDTPDKTQAVRALVATRFTERNAVLSPNGRWLAYEANDDGQFQIYVRPYPNVNAERRLVSAGGGTQPLWSRGGDELFYVTLDGTLMSVSVGSGEAWSGGKPSPVGIPKYFAGNSSSGRTYDVSVDGKKFLTIKNAEAGGEPPPAIVVVRNWFGELERLVPSRR